MIRRVLFIALAAIAVCATTPQAGVAGQQTLRVTVPPDGEMANTMLVIFPADERLWSSSTDLTAASPTEACSSSGRVGTAPSAYARSCQARMQWVPFPGCRGIPTAPIPCG
jgi:hypothetical protein